MQYANIHSHQTGVGEPIIVINTFGNTAELSGNDGTLEQQALLKQTRFAKMRLRYALQTVPTDGMSGRREP